MQTANSTTKSILPVFIVSLFVFLILSLSSYFLPATWDEGEMSFRAVESPHWVGTVNAEGHPQVPVILASLGRFIFPQPLSTGSLRFGSILFFSLACGMCFYRIKQLFGKTAAVFFIPSVLLIPRLFAHCQIAAWDSALISAWMLAWAFYPRQETLAAKKKKLSKYIIFGICLGLTLSCKFSGWAVFLPFGLFFLIESVKNFRAGNVNALIYFIFISLPVSIFVFYVLNPPLWTHPVNGFIEFLQLNTSRGSGHYNVAVLFFGTMYDLNHPLPWYNTLVWIAVTVPAGILFLSAVGIVVSFTKHRQEGILLLLNFLTLPVIRSFPGTPVHDGVRLFVSCFPFLAVFAAIGAAFLWNKKDLFTVRIADVFKVKAFICNRTVLFNGNFIVRFAVIAVFSASILNMLVYSPQYLSFYNAFIGGLSGAVNKGMEAAYYWDSFDREATRWLSEHTESNEKVAFSAASAKSILLNRNSCWDKNIKFFSFEPVVILPQTTLEELKSGRGNPHVRYYVLQHRPSGEFERDKQLIQQTDVSVKCVFRKQKNNSVFKDGQSVPLLEIYQLRR
ncbi:hypothetical protein FACS189427_05880 [Planctomycetales bacterium]|nr:hypothetical protein FACS189427_05880 [Planctomycetales bacterium]